MPGTKILSALLIWAITFFNFGQSSYTVQLDTDANPVTMETGGILSFSSGKKVDPKKLSKETLGNGLVTYQIPREWLGVKTEDDVSELLDGVGYDLSSLKGGKKPELLYVFCFDNELLLSNPGQDMARTNEIEEAIIKNILGKSPGILGFPQKRTTGYGISYNHYASVYVDKNDATHHVEFCFTPAGNTHIFGMLYVCDDTAYKTDILACLKTLSIKS